MTLKPIATTPTENKVLAALAIIGLLVPNGVFIYFFFTDPEIAKEALGNPISLVFICEAFFLMFLFAWLLKKWSIARPNGFIFILMSMIGSMAFSVPATLYLIFKRRNSD